MPRSFFLPHASSSAIRVRSPTLTNARVNFFPTNRLYTVGCVWGCVLVMLWKVVAGFEGVLATRRYGYGCCWLPMAALGLALTWQARICFHHSCESDLFQVWQRTQRIYALRALIGENPTDVLRPPSSGCEGPWSKGLRHARSMSTRPLRPLAGSKPLGWALLL